MSKAPHEEVRRAVTDAYYHRAIAAPDAARSRAQAAYAIAGAVATAVVAAGVFTNLSDRPTLVQIAGLLAFVAWIVTAGLFMYAVAAPHVRLSAPREVRGPAAFVAAAMKAAAEERRAVDRRQLLARIAAGAASTLTVVVVVLAVFIQTPSDNVRGWVRLDSTDRHSLSALCGSRLPTLVSGTIDKGSLGDGTINFVPSTLQCRNSGNTSLDEDRVPYILEG